MTVEVYSDEIGRWRWRLLDVDGVPTGDESQRTFSKRSSACADAMGANPDVPLSVEAIPPKEQT